MPSNAATMAAMSAEVDAFGVAAVIATAQTVVEYNNQGGPGAPPAPIDTGELRGSVRLTIGTPSSESPDSPPFSLVTYADIARAFQLGGFSLGDPVILSWIAEHAAIIDGGRRMGSRGMLGSEQAPDGWVEQDAEAAAATMRSWKFNPGGSPR